MFIDQFKNLETYNREMVRSTAKTMAALQDQTQSAIRIGLENTPYLPEAGKMAVRQWADNFKEGSDFCSKAMMEACDHYAAFLKSWE